MPKYNIRILYIFHKSNNKKLLNVNKMKTESVRGTAGLGNCETQRIPETKRTNPGSAEPPLSKVKGEGYKN
jgi:hypothetical protein